MPHLKHGVAKSEMIYETLATEIKILGIGNDQEIQSNLVCNSEGT